MIHRTTAGLGAAVIIVAACATQDSGGVLLGPSVSQPGTSSSTAAPVPSASSTAPVVDDPGWTSLSWAHCLLELANNPETETPPLQWAECSPAVDGCSIATFGYDVDARGVIGAYVYGVSMVAVEGGYRVAVALEPRDNLGTTYQLIYGVDGTPTAVLRARIPPPGLDYCEIIPAVVTADLVWLGAQRKTASFMEEYHAVTTYSRVADARAIGATLLAWSPYLTASRDALALGGAGASVLYDRVTGRAHALAPAYMNPTVAYPVGEDAVFTVAEDSTNWQAWSWDHVTQAAAPLIVPTPGQAVLSLGTDGDTLAWIQTPVVDSEIERPIGDLWTAPFTTSASAVRPTRRRSGPSVGTYGSVAARGFYAVDSWDGDYHVYRLSDARHWAVQAPYDVPGLYYVDDRYLVYATESGIVRQSIAALGEGDPPDEP